MCSVVGYIGNNMCRNVVLQGLERLEYRGYDSAGFACLNPIDKRLRYHKTVGKLDELIIKLSEDPIDGHIGIGHTRWATHGITTFDNAHPHFDCTKSLSIVHNGIIENHHELRQSLIENGHIFASATDTEIIAHMFEDAFKVHKNPKAALTWVVSKLEGAYACILLSQQYPDQLMLVRKGSPLCIGLGDDEMYIASDLIAFAGKTNKVLFLPDATFALVKKNALELYDFQGRPAEINIQKVDVAWKDDGKQGYDHFMLKEIYEQKRATHETLHFCQTVSLVDQLGISAAQIQDLGALHFIACGTSWHAGLLGQFFFEEIVKIPIKVSLASEFRYRPFFPEKNCLYIAISQSGETADTLESIMLVNNYNVPTVALTNVASSSLVRDTGGFLLTHAGQEIAVASTKAFTTQVTVLFWLAHTIAYKKKLISAQQLEHANEELLVATNILENGIENYRIDIEKKHAPYYAKFKRFIFLGRDITYPLALEAALKLKEISYIFAQAYPAGELKHGPIALIDSETPVVIFSHLDPLLYQKLVSNAQEVKARKGHVIAFAFEGQHELIALADLVFTFPRVHPLLGPLAMTGLMQFFAYQIAKELGCPIDKPRNLAKSVTVE